MKIAITATAPGLEAAVDPRFGRAPYFTLVDPETMESESLENNAATSGGGVGVATAQLVSGKGITAVLTGNCGPNAHQVLTAAGVVVMTGVSGTVREAVAAYQAGALKAAAEPNVGEHSGRGQ